MPIIEDNIKIEEIKNKYINSSNLMKPCADWTVHYSCCRTGQAG